MCKTHCGLSAGRVPLPCSCGHRNVSFENMCYSVMSFARRCDLAAGLRGAVCHPGDEGRWADALRQHGPLGVVCGREACELCRQVGAEGGTGRHSAISGAASSGGSSSSDGGGDAGGKQQEQQQQQQRPPGYCPARRLALNASTTFWQLLPPLSRALLLTGGKGYASERNLHAMCTALTAVCMRVQAEEYHREREQQQRGAAAKPSGGGKASRGKGAAAPSGAQGGVQGRSVAMGSDIGCTTKEEGCSSWRELLLSLQPFRLVTLAMQARAWRDADQVIPAALSALALAVPEPFAAALAADRELAEGIVRGVRGAGQGREPDVNLAGVLQRVLPALPPCRAVEALEAKCALPVVSRAKRQAAREGLRRAWAARARACVLVGVREVQEAEGGWNGGAAEDAERAGVYVQMLVGAGEVQEAQADV